MAQKFGNGRWVKEGFLDNRVPGTVVGRIVFAAVGPVDIYWHGDFRGEIEGRLIRFRNRRFEEDELAGHVIGDLDNPQVGTVNLISFDPHPNLAPHPYIEWFSSRNEHYCIELLPEDAWIAGPADMEEVDGQSRNIREALTNRAVKRPAARDDSEWV